MHLGHRAVRTTPARPRVPPAVLLAALVAAGTSSCSLLSLGADPGASTQTLADGSSFLVSAPTNSYHEAIVSGRLALIGDDCVGLESPGGGETSALALPHGTQPSDDGRAIVLPDGLRIALGDSISGGGGYLTLSGAPDAFDAWPEAPPSCAEATYLAGIYDVELGERQ